MTGDRLAGGHATALRAAATRRGWALLALAGALLALCYYLLFVVLVLALVALALARRRGPPRRSLGRTGALLGAVAALTAVFWVPLVLSVLRGAPPRATTSRPTSSRSRSRFNGPAELVVLAVVAVIALALAFAWPAAQAVGVLLGATIGYQLLSVTTLVFSENQLQPHRAVTMMWATLGAAVPVALEGMSRSGTLGAQLPPAATAGGRARDRRDRDPPRRSCSAPPQGRDLSTGPLTVGAHDPVDMRTPYEIGRFITNATGRPATDLTVLTDDRGRGVLVTQPFHGFLPLGARYAHPEARLGRRVRAVRAMAACQTMACTTRALTVTGFGPVDAVVLTRTGTGVQLTAQLDHFPLPRFDVIAFRPALFDRNVWARRWFGDLLVLVRRPYGAVARAGSAPSGTRRHSPTPVSTRAGRAGAQPVEQPGAIEPQGPHAAQLVHAARRRPQEGALGRRRRGAPPRGEHPRPLPQLPPPALKREPARGQRLHGVAELVHGPDDTGGRPRAATLAVRPSARENPRMRRLPVLLLAVFLLMPSVGGAVEAKNRRGVKILGGAEAAPGQFPWMAALMDAKAQHAIDGTFCGGTLIAARVVLTAAHCVEGTRANEVNVVLGRTRLTQETDGERIAVTKIVVHAGYDPNSVLDDVAVLQLAQPSVQQPMPIAHPADDGLTTPGTRVLTLGFGATQEGGQISDSLRFVRLTMRSHGYCDREYGKIRDRSQLCIGSSRAGEDSCQGDSGGPVISGEDVAARLVGTVSYGNGCGRAGVPGVYTRVSYYADWIDAHAAELNGDAVPPAAGRQPARRADRQDPLRHHLLQRLPAHDRPRAGRRHRLQLGAQAQQGPQAHRRRRVRQAALADALARAGAAALREPDALRLPADEHPGRPRRRGRRRPHQDLLAAVRGHGAPGRPAHARRATGSIRSVHSASSRSDGCSPSGAVSAGSAIARDSTKTSATAIPRVRHSAAMIALNARRPAVASRPPV